MGNRFSRSWELAKATMTVLRGNKELIVYPIVSFIGSLVVIASFAVPFYTLNRSRFSGDQQFSNDPQSNIIYFATLFLFYLVLYTVIYFANAALIGAAMISLRGGKPTIGAGFRIAAQHFGSIVGYALISATIGMVLRALSERFGLIGRLIISALGIAWSVATFLVVPVLIFENVNPIDGVKRSANLLKRTWGEQVILRGGVGLVFGLINLAVILVGVALIFALHSLVFTLGIVGLMILTFVSTGILSSTLSGIYTAAIYRYATENSIDGHFDPQLVRGAFQPKRQ